MNSNVHPCIINQQALQGIGYLNIVSLKVLLLQSFNFERPKQRCHGTHVLRILLSVQKLRCQIYCEAYTCDLLTSNVNIVCDNNHLFYWIQRKCNNIVHLFLQKCSLQNDLILKNEKASLACNGFVCHISNIKGLATRPGTYGYIYASVIDLQWTFSCLYSFLFSSLKMFCSSDSCVLIPINKGVCQMSLPLVWYTSMSQLVNGL